MTAPHTNPTPITPSPAPAPATPSRHSKPHTLAQRLRTNFLSGIFVLIPIGVTLWVIVFIANLLSGLGTPIVDSFATQLERGDRNLTPLQPMAPWIRAFQYFISVVFAATLIYLLGWLTNKVVGKKLLQAFDAVMGRIPLVQGIYGMSKQLLMSFQQRPDGPQRVVLVHTGADARMRSVGLVMRTMIDPTTRRELAAIYVPLSPNPTMGMLQVMPLDEVTTTDWTVDEAMKFVVSGGAVGPAELHFGAVDPAADGWVTSPLLMGPGATAWYS